MINLLFRSSIFALLALVLAWPAQAASEKALEAQVNRLMSELKASQAPASPAAKTGTIATPGVNGTLTATSLDQPASTTELVEGSLRRPVLSFALEASGSDVKVERIKVKLDQTSGGEVDKDFLSVARKMHVMRGETILATVELNDETAIQEATGIYVTVGGLGLVVKKDVKEVLTVALDAESQIREDLAGGTWSVTLPQAGIRGVDGAGANVFSPALGFIAGSFVSVLKPAEVYDLTLYTPVESQMPREVLATKGANDDELRGEELMKFVVGAEKDAVISSITANIAAIGYGESAATASTTYLYRDNKLVDVAVMTGAEVVFSNVNTRLKKGETASFSLKADIKKAGVRATIFKASVSSSGVSAHLESGAARVNGEAKGSNITVRKIGPEFELISTGINYSPAQIPGATSTARADFVLRVTAVGTDVILGSRASTTFPMVGQRGRAITPSFVVYRAGEPVALNVASSTFITIPAQLIPVPNGSLVLPKNETVDIPISFTFEGRDAKSFNLIPTGKYSVSLERVNWMTLEGGRQFSSFMVGDLDWRTRDIIMP